MTRVAILPVPGQGGEVSYHAVAGGRQSEGRTAGEALDALSAQLTDDDGALIIVQRWRSDSLFTAAQQERLKALMDRWREARDRGESLTAAEQLELDELVQAELSAAGKRAATLAAELGA